MMGAKFCLQVHKLVGLLLSVQEHGVYLEEEAGLDIQNVRSLEELRLYIHSKCTGYRISLIAADRKKTAQARF